MDKSRFDNNRLSFKRSNFSSINDVGGCRFVFKRGRDKGKYCGGGTAEGQDYCNFCLKNTRIRLLIQDEYNSQKSNVIDMKNNIVLTPNTTNNPIEEIVTLNTITSLTAPYPLSAD